MATTSAAVTLFGWGSLGGVAMAIVVFALPALVHLAMVNEPVPYQRTRTVALALAVLMLGIVAGIVALTLPDTASRSEAIIAGFASQGILKGLISAGREALPFARG